MKESLAKIDKRLVFRETFQSEQNTRKNVGIPINVDYSNGVGSFNGSPSNIEYGNFSYLVSKGEYSVRIKFKTTTTSASTILRIDNWMVIRILADGVLFVWATSGNSQKSSGSYNDGQWHEIVFSVGSPTNYGYVDGDEFNAISWGSITLGVTNILNIGSLNGSSEFFNGDIDLAEIYDVALTANEVALLYENSLYKEPNFNSGGLKELLSIDPGLGTIADSYGNTLTSKETIDIIPSGGYRVEKYDGSASKLGCGNIGNTKSLIFWINPLSLTEQILEGAANDKLVHINAGTLTYPEFDNAYVDGVETDTMVANKWQCVMITSATDVDMSALTWALNNASYGKILLGAKSLNNGLIPVKTYENYYHSTKGRYGL